MIAFILKRGHSNGCDHNCLVTHERRWRDWFMPTYVVRCCRCSLRIPGFRTLWEAWNRAFVENGTDLPGIGKKL